MTRRFQTKQSFGVVISGIQTKGSNTNQTRRAKYATCSCDLKQQRFTFILWRMKSLVICLKYFYLMMNEKDLSFHITTFGIMIKRLCKHLLFPSI